MTCFVRSPRRLLCRFRVIKNAHPHHIRKWELDHLLKSMGCSNVRVFEWFLRLGRTLGRIGQNHPVAASPGASAVLVQKVAGGCIVLQLKPWLGERLSKIIKNLSITSKKPVWQTCLKAVPFPDKFFRFSQGFSGLLHVS